MNFSFQNTLPKIENKICRVRHVTQYLHALFSNLNICDARDGIRFERMTIYFMIQHFIGINFCNKNELV